MECQTSNIFYFQSQFFSSEKNFCKLITNNIGTIFELSIILCIGWCVPKTVLWTKNNNSPVIIRAFWTIICRPVVKKSRFIVELFSPFRTVFALSISKKIVKPGKFAFASYYLWARNLHGCMLSRQMGLRHKKTEDAKKCPFCYTLRSFPSKITRTMWTTFNSDGFTLKHTHGQLLLFWYRCPHLTYRYWNL